ncbi:hypothetical protein ACFY40_28520 [Streptomyces sp. NPDC012950]|uniref:hypothetical protein n=1 Tax=Streptomyces sp. NPDC012950 TaxID=3364858 RepID=UPI003691DABB
MLCGEEHHPSGHSGDRSLLVSGEVHPVDPYDEEASNGTWLLPLMGDRRNRPGPAGAGHGRPPSRTARRYRPAPRRR